MLTLRFSPLALQDMLQIKAYVAQELGAPEAANGIMGACERLRQFPQMGAPLSSVLPIRTDYRFLVCGSYLVFYKADGQTVSVYRVLYGRRDYLKTLFGQLPDADAEESENQP